MLQQRVSPAAEPPVGSNSSGTGMSLCDHQCYAFNSTPICVAGYAALQSRILDLESRVSDPRGRRRAALRRRNADLEAQVVAIAGACVGALVLTRCALSCASPGFRLQRVRKQRDPSLQI